LLSISTTRRLEYTLALSGDHQRTAANWTATSLDERTVVHGWEGEFAGVPVGGRWPQQRFLATAAFGREADRMLPARSSP
jgi:hypothetical protein